MKGKILRDEVFGSTVYDRKKLIHSFLNHEQTAETLVKDPGIEYWEADTTGLRKDIIYSPIRIYYELTTGCNLRCRTCFNSSGNPLNDELTTSEVLKLLDGLRKEHVFDIRFTGGELTTKEGWDEILQHAMDLGFGVSMNTNGVYDDPKNLEKLIKIQPHQVTLSFDGLKETHDYIRGKGNFDRSFQSLLTLYNAGVPTRTNTLITHEVADRVEDMIQFFEPYVSDMAFFNMRLVGRARNIQSRGISYSELREFNQKMSKIVPNHPTIRILYREDGENLNGLQEYEKVGLSTGRCPGGLTRFVMTSEGNYHACGYLPYINPESLVPGSFLGNAKSDGFAVIKTWRSSSSLEEYRKLNSKTTQECFSCAVYDSECPGVCLADELNKYNFEGGVNPYCIEGKNLEFLHLRTKK